jgi:hypothetical protein
MILTEETEVLGKIPVPVPLCPSTNPTWTGMRLKLGLRSERPANHWPSHGMARNLSLRHYITYTIGIALLNKKVKLWLSTP